MSGAVLLLVGTLLVGLASVRLASVLARGSFVGLLLCAYCLAWLEVGLVMFALSPFAAVTRAWLLGAFAVIAVAASVATRGRGAPLAPRARDAVRTLRVLLADPLLAVLAAGVAAALTYALALTLLTPQNDFDTIYDHLWRAGLWFQGAALGYPDCACAPYINAYPPLGEIGTTLTMVLGQSDRYAGLPQAAAYGALVLGVVGIARRIGLGPAESLFGGLLAATLPVLALQASTAQNDLVVAAFVVAAAVFLLDGATSDVSRWSWSLTALATALAVGTKVSAPFAIPLLLAVAVLVPRGASWRTRLVHCGAVALGVACGSFWYWVNRAQLGAFDGGFPAETSVGHGLADMVARIDRMAILFVDAPGAAGRDVLLFPLAALAIAVVVAVRARSHPRRALSAAGIVAAIGFAPMLLSALATQLERVHVKVWTLAGRDDLAYVDIGRSITLSASNTSWYGPLGSLLLIGAVAAVVVAVRRRRVDRLALLFALAPAYWLVAYGALLAYQTAAGRFFMAPMALAAATWGTVARYRAVAWGVTAVAVVAVGLALLNDAKRPSGIRLLEPTDRQSYFTTPRWAGQGEEARAAELTRYLDEHVPGDVTVALAITPNDPGFVFFGRGLDRRLVLVGGSGGDVPAATWAFTSPSATDSLCDGAWMTLPERPQGWVVQRRIAGGTCS